MANWCSTIITFYSESEEQINNLHDVLSELDKGESLLPNGFGNLWLGNILHRFGFDWKKLHCRGSITHYDDEVFQDQDGRFYFEIHQEDAWSPLTEVWDAVLSRPGFKICLLTVIAVLWLTNMPKSWGFETNPKLKKENTSKNYRRPQ